MNSILNLIDSLTTRGKVVFGTLAAILVLVIFNFIFPTPDYDPVCLTHEQADVLVHNLHKAKTDGESTRAWNAITAFKGDMTLVDEATGEVAIKWECLK